MPEYVETNESFLPRILSVFYAVFDPLQGPKIVYQVPEGSIGVHTHQSSSTILGAQRRTLVAEPESGSLHPYTPLRFRDAPSNPESPSPSSGHPSTVAFFEFDSISEYVIPKAELCGRLVHCNTPRHRILGFPVLLLSPEYPRNMFNYNLCFVFDRMADLSCYEPIVRKCGRVLMSCEEESSFLSNPQTSIRVYPILEQLFEDLNSYSETSIPVNSFNSIELKIFPYYPNPPKVYDWQVPVALINLGKRRDPSWDLTMAKVCPHINGVRHVAKIAELADATRLLTRQCIEHLLFYQCIMMIDIFQFSNMYMLKSSIQWLADDPDVQQECAAYVTQADHPLQSWPTLLHLYSRFKAGKTVDIWMEENGVFESGIDVRRFVTFGVIKGFLRRIHRWPVLLPKVALKRSQKFNEPTAEGGEGETPPSLGVSAADFSGPSSYEEPSLLLRSSQSSSMVSFSPTTPTATSVLSQAHGLSSSMTPPGGVLSGLQDTPRMPNRRLSHASVAQWPMNEYSRFPESLPALLDGSHHADELCTMYGVSWSGLEKYLAEVGGSSIDDELGRVRIIYR